MQNVKINVFEHGGVDREHALKFQGTKESLCETIIASMVGKLVPMILRGFNNYRMGCAWMLKAHNSRRVSAHALSLKILL